MVSFSVAQAIKIYLYFIYILYWMVSEPFFQVPRMPLILGFSMINLLMLYKMSTKENATFVLTKPILYGYFFLLCTIIWFICCSG